MAFIRGRMLIEQEMVAWAVEKHIEDFVEKGSRAEYR